MPAVVLLVATSGPERHPMGIAVAVLDLDHARPERGRHRHAIGHGVEAAELHDGDARQGVLRRRLATDGRGVVREQAVIGVEHGRRSFDDERRVGEVGNRPDLADRPMGRVHDRHHVTVVHDLRVLRSFFAGRRDLERDIGAGLEQGQPVLQVLLPKRLPEHVLPLLRVLGGGEPGQIGEPRIIQHVGDAGHLGQRLALVGQHRRGLDEAPVPGGDQDAVAAGTDRGTGIEQWLLTALGHQLGDGRDEVVDGIEPGHHGGAQPLPASSPARARAARRGCRRRPASPLRSCPTGPGSGSVRRGARNLRRANSPTLAATSGS